MSLIGAVYLLDDTGIREYGYRVKATVELPEDLMIAAKKRAAELRRPLRELVESGLRYELHRTRKTRARPKPIKISWVTVKGGLPTGLDMSDRGAMHEWLKHQR